MSCGDAYTSSASALQFPGAEKTVSQLAEPIPSIFPRTLSWGSTSKYMSDAQLESDAEEGSSSPDTSTKIESAPPLSKKAQKKAVKAARFAAQKLERRAREKEAKKEKKKLKRAAEEQDNQDGEVQGEAAIPRKRARVGSAIKFGARLVVDLGFDDKMTDKEIVSLTSQLAYTYSANRKAVRPFETLLFTSLNGKTLARLESLSDAGYKRWIGTVWWTDSYERLWKDKEPEVCEHEMQQPPAASIEPETSSQNVVYLTADSSEELTELKEGETYIIGGICDHNRYKNLCQDKAVSTGIRSARLPIGTYLAQLPTRKVLTVNQVVEILLKWIETNNWENALYSVMPKRKFHQGRSRNHDTGDKQEDIEPQVIVVGEDLEP